MYVGTDPEFFVVEKKSGRSVPAHILGIPNIKEQKITRGVDIASYGRDGWAVELNTSAHSSVTDLIGEVRRGLHAVQTSIGPDYRLAAAASVPVDPKTQLSLDDPIDTRTFGCDPDFDAYKLCAKIPALDAMTYKFRPAGGHLHFGTDNIESSRLKSPYCHPQEAILLNADNYPEIVRLLDWYIGVPLAYIYDDPMQWERRRWYGQAGSFRPQVYPIAKRGFSLWGSGREPAVGLEYRTPPPQVFNAEEVASMFLSIGRWVIHNFADLYAMYDPFMADDIQGAINEGHGIKMMAALAATECPMLHNGILSAYKTAYKEFDLAA